MLPQATEWVYISKINLRNWMCHANFTTDFSAHINFIGGENGSGKSSVLAAISFGLGASAAAIGRGSSVKDCIGAHGTSTTVRISLVQPKAAPSHFSFNKQLEGAMVVVERTASKAGGSTFKIMDGHGKVISTKKQDLDKFKQHFNIQVIGFHAKLRFFPLFSGFFVIPRVVHLHLRGTPLRVAPATIGFPKKWTAKPTPTPPFPSPGQTSRSKTPASS